MILEGIVTTREPDGGINVAPMGPIVDTEMSGLHLRPFKSSRTYQNLKQHPEGVFHVVDDVLLLAEAAIGTPREKPSTFPAKEIDGEVLSGACRWYEFHVDRFDDAQDRTSLHATVVHSGRLRDFFGFNRAKHAVLEAAILSTRLHILPAGDVRRQLDALKSPIEKTAGPREREAFERIMEYVEATLGN